MKNPFKRKTKITIDIEKAAKQAEQKMKEMFDRGPKAEGSFGPPPGMCFIPITESFCKPGNMLRIVDENRAEPALAVSDVLERLDQKVEIHFTPYRYTGGRDGQWSMIFDVDRSIDGKSFGADGDRVLEKMFALEGVRIYGDRFVVAFEKAPSAEEVGDIIVRTQKEVRNIIASFDQMKKMYDVLIQGWLPPTWFNNGQFELAITDVPTSHRGYNYDAETGLAPDVIQFGQAAGGQMVWVDIPAGTVVTDENGDPVLKVLVVYHNYYGIEPYIQVVKPGIGQGQGEIFFSQGMKISRACGPGEWKEIVTVDHVADGIVPLP